MKKVYLPGTQDDSRTLGPRAAIDMTTSPRMLTSFSLTTEGFWSPSNTTSLCLIDFASSEFPTPHNLSFYIIASPGSQIEFPEAKPKQNKTKHPRWRLAVVVSNSL